MKRVFFASLVCIISGLCTANNTINYYQSLPRFSAINSQGFELWYGKLSDSTAVLVPENSTLGMKIAFDAQAQIANYDHITSDTLIIPETAICGNATYTIIGISPIAVFYGMKVTTLYLPKTIAFIGDTIIHSEFLPTDDNNWDPVYGDVNYAFMCAEKLQKVHIDENNPYFISVNGIVYTKDMKNLVLFPMGRKDTYFAPPEGCEHILRAAFANDTTLQEIEFPNTLKSIGHWAFAGVTNLKKVVLKDSISAIGELNCFYTHEMQIGKGVTNFPPLSVKWAIVEKWKCYSLIPPILPSNIRMNSESVLYVPRNSISAYANDNVWGQIKSIYPIEPPIVAGVDQAIVSWVQNFSATGYVWTLYSDEAHTQMVMTLTFDQRGYLTGIVLGNAASATQRALAQNVAADNGNSGNDNGSGDDSEKRFAEYYSFTISSLNRNTQYYYTRQSLSDDKVIDEESGSFATSDKTPTSTESATSPDDTNSDTTALKIISNGKVYILRDGKVYTSVGVEVK